MQINSITAYLKFKDSGLLTQARKRAFNGLCIYGPCTAQELVKSINYPGAWKRLSELEDQGFIKRAETRNCDITGELASVWEVISDAEPIPYVKKERRGKPLGQRVRELEARVEELEAALSNLSTTGEAS